MWWGQFHLDSFQKENDLKNECHDALNGILVFLSWMILDIFYSTILENGLGGTLGTLHQI